MLIVCPNCSRSYLVRAAQVQHAERLVRCSMCKMAWRIETHPQQGAESFHGVSEPLSQDDFAASPPLTPEFKTRPEPKLRQKRSISRFVAMGAATVALASFTFWVGNSKLDGIVARALGWIDAVLPSSSVSELSFSNLKTTILSENGETALMVEGEILSDSTQEKTLPQIECTMRDGTESVIFQWMVSAQVATIVKGEPVPFKARLASPPRDGKDIMIRFSGA